MADDELLRCPSHRGAAASSQVVDIQLLHNHLSPPALLPFTIISTTNSSRGVDVVSGGGRIGFGDAEDLSPCGDKALPERTDCP